MLARFVVANSYVKEDSGKVAIMRELLFHYLEQEDDGEYLHTLIVNLISH